MKFRWPRQLQARLDGRAWEARGMELRLPGGWRWLEVTIQGQQLPALIDVCLVNDGGLPGQPFRMPSLHDGETRRVIAVSSHSSALRLQAEGLRRVCDLVEVRLRPLPSWSVAWLQLQTVLRLRPELGGTVGMWRKSLRRWVRKGYRGMRWDLFCDYELAIGCPGSAVAMRHDDHLQRCPDLFTPRSIVAFGAPRVGFLVDVGGAPEAVGETLMSLAALAPTPVWVGLLSESAEELERAFAAVDAWPIPLLDAGRLVGRFADGADWVGWLRAGDRVAPDLLTTVAEVASREEGLQLLYTDDATIGAGGQACSPRYKSGWNPDWLYGTDYIGRAVLLRAPLLDDIRSRQPALPLGDPYPLVLQASFGLGEAQVQHVPRVMFQLVPPRASRVGSGDPAASVLEAQFPGLTVSPGRTSQSRRLHWPVPPRPPKVTLVIPTRDGGSYLARCLESIRERTEYAPYRVMVVDNGSQCPQTLDYLGRQVEAGLIDVLTLNIPFNYSTLNNRAVAAADGELVGFLNDDVEVLGGDWLTELVANACRPPIGCVGAKLLYPDRTIQHAGVVTGMPTAANHVYRFFPDAVSGYMDRLCSAQNYSAVTGACMVMRRQVFDEVGGFDEALAVNFNDLDLCLRVRAAGYRNLWSPWSVLYHCESVTRGQEERRSREARGKRESRLVSERWAIRRGRDPYYNPNLATDRLDFSPAPCRRVLR